MTAPSCGECGRGFEGRKSVDRESALSGIEKDAATEESDSAGKPGEMKLEQGL